MMFIPQELQELLEKPKTMTSSFLLPTYVGWQGGGEEQKYCADVWATRQDEKVFIHFVPFINGEDTTEFPAFNGKIVSEFVIELTQSLYDEDEDEEGTFYYGFCETITLLLENYKDKDVYTIKWDMFGEVMTIELLIGRIFILLFKLMSNNNAEYKII